MTPKLSPIRQDNTHRLVPSRHSDDSVFTRLAEGEGQLRELSSLMAPPTIASWGRPICFPASACTNCCLASNTRTS